MDLREFVKRVLQQVVEGAVDAQEAVQEHGGAVNPLAMGGKKIGEEGLLDNEGRPLQLIDFDVAVTTTETTEGSAMLAVFGFGGGLRDSEAASSVSRVRFRIPVRLPRTE